MNLRFVTASLSVAALSVGAVVLGGGVANAAPAATATTASAMAPQSSYDCIQWVEAFGWLYSDDRQRACDLGEAGHTSACADLLEDTGMSNFESVVSCAAADD
ncbi:MAG TPA: hypothetical protein VGD48_16445 [Kutzneria sp.]|jgi:hypothetical protein